MTAARFGSFSFHADGTAGRSEVARPVRTFTSLYTSDIYLLYVLPTERDVFRMVFVIGERLFHYTTLAGRLYGIFCEGGSRTLIIRRI